MIKMNLGLISSISYPANTTMSIKILSKGYEYSFDDVYYYGFEYSIPEILILNSVKIIENDIISITQEEGGVFVSGVKSNAPVLLISIDGMIISNSKTDVEGSIFISTEGLKKGVYILKADGLTFKFARL
jgi:hypothetical protein